MEIFKTVILILACITIFIAICVLIYVGFDTLKDNKKKPKAKVKERLNSLDEFVNMFYREKDFLNLYGNNSKYITIHKKDNFKETHLEYVIDNDKLIDFLLSTGIIKERKY